MRKSTICLSPVILLVLLAPAALAQETTSRDKGQGYVFAGFGSINSEASILHFGGGIEANLYKGLGFGLEAGYLAPAQYAGLGVGTVSLDGQYTFGTGRPGRLRPFLTGGYTLAFRNGTANAFNFGGGIHYWFSRRSGLRLEFRDHVSPTVWDTHAWQGRIGIEFR